MQRLAGQRQEEVEIELAEQGPRRCGIGNRHQRFEAKRQRAATRVRELIRQVCRGRGAAPGMELGAAKVTFQRDQPTVDRPAYRSGEGMESLATLVGQLPGDRLE
jgi:hypothetical protein